MCNFFSLISDGTGKVYVGYIGPHLPTPDTEVPVMGHASIYQRLQPLVARDCRRAWYFVTLG